MTETITTNELKPVNNTMKTPLSEYKQPEGWYSHTPGEPTAFTNGAWYERSKIMRDSDLKEEKIKRLIQRKIDELDSAFWKSPGWVTDREMLSLSQQIDTLKELLKEIETL